MRVNPANSAPVQHSGSAATQKSEKLKSNSYDHKSESPSRSVKTDSAQAEISSRAKHMANAKQIASDTPDVRESKIAALREQIQNKKYNVSADKIADKLVDDHIKLMGA